MRASNSAGLILLASISSAIQAQSFNVLYNLQGGINGADPQSGVVSDRAGNLYGTTYEGGNCSNCGVVYQLVPNGPAYTASIIHVFSGAPSDGAGPVNGSLTVGPGGNLYGTTTTGGSGSCYGGCGTVFKLTDTGGSWTQEILYSFISNLDGSFPESPVTFDSQGNLFGTTPYGGDKDGGTVFKLTPSASGWAKSIVFTFPGVTGLSFPLGALILDRTGNIYGEAGSSNQIYGGGGIFEISPTLGGWTGKSIYSFTSFSTGLYPAGGLLPHGGKLYGVASNGGGVTCPRNEYGCGVVFELSPAPNGWTETVLHTFTGASDGAYPQAVPVFDDSGNLYATAQGGILSTSYGTVYRLTPTTTGWNFNLLHAFTGGSDGSGPSGALILKGGRIFGTATAGGLNGAGTVFELN